MNIGEKMHGFQVEKVTELQELDAKLIEMLHEQTGLRLIWLDREEENKTFSIAFRTEPWNDTGVFHILEHSVLNGSDRYPVKEPFVSLLQSSMNTFLNALTFPDKTVYPVASKNTKDFFNLTRVYLDAVFHPSIHHKEEIFMQEGWHYEFDENGDATYKGVVFNEMKGAFADEDELKTNEIDRALFPDTEYRFVSGGDPKKIPDLTYENFLAAHRKFYAPANAIIALDGTMDIDAVLEMIDGEYLKDFGKGETIAQPALQQTVDGGEREVKFEISEAEDAEKRYSAIRAYVFADYADREKRVAVDALSSVLAGNNEAYLPKIILEKGLAESVSIGGEDEIYQPTATIEIHNARKEDLDEADRLVMGEIERLAAEGLDHEQLRAVLTQMEFRERERDFGTLPMGLILAIAAQTNMQYGMEPSFGLEPGDLYEKLRNKTEEGYFENLLREVFLENEHKCRIIMIPDREKGEADRAEEATRLKERASKWSAEEKNALIEKGQKLIARQQSEDTPEALATIPKLKIEDIETEPEKVPTEISEANGIRIMRHPLNAAGILYYRIYFKVPSAGPEEIMGTTSMMSLIGKLRTKRHSVTELTTLRKKYTGSISFGCASVATVRTNELGMMPFVEFSVLPENREKAFELAMEMLTETEMNDENAIFNIFRQGKTAMENLFTMSGNFAARIRAGAQYNLQDAMAEYCGGYEKYKWLKAIVDGGDKHALAERMQTLYGRTFYRTDATVSVTGQGEDGAEEMTAEIARIFPEAESRGGIQVQLFESKDEGIAIPADIAFAVLGGRLEGMPFGKALVINKVMTFTYLWNTIRVQGGAYGCGMRTARKGVSTFYSYRDPNPARSLGEYRKAGDFLREFSKSGEDLTGQIIGTIADASPLLSPRMKGEGADSDYFIGLTWEDRAQERRDTLSTTMEDLEKAADALDRMTENGHVCVIGAKPKLESMEGMEIIGSL